MVVALLGCKGKQAPPAPEPTGSGSAVAGSATPAVPHRAPPEPARPRPVISLSANGSTEADLVLGRSLIVELALVHPTPFDTSSTPLVIASGANTWADAIRIEVRDHARQPQTWPLQQLVTKPAAVLELDTQAAGELIWRLSPEQVAAVPAGDYTMVAILDTTASRAPNAWKGRVASVPIAVKLGAAPTRAQALETLWWLGRDAAMRGDAQEAAARIDELLTKDPTSAMGLSAKGDLLAQQGKLEAALTHYGRALERYRAIEPRPSEPPAELLRKQADLLDRLDTAKPRP